MFACFCRSRPLCGGKLMPGCCFVGLLCIRGLWIVTPPLAYFCFFGRASCFGHVHLAWNVRIRHTCVGLRLQSCFRNVHISCVRVTRLSCATRRVASTPAIQLGWKVSSLRKFSKFFNVQRSEWCLPDPFNYSWWKFSTTRKFSWFFMLPHAFMHWDGHYLWPRMGISYVVRLRSFLVFVCVFVI